ncbi:MAG: MFS transporter [Pseudomonadota bacterium]
MADSATGRRWVFLCAMSGVLGLIVLDETIVAVSLPVITNELSFYGLSPHWVVNAFLLSFTCTVAIAGRLGDHFGRRIYFCVGAVLLALASVLAALAPDGVTLIVARGLQGIAAAMISPTAFALIRAAFAPEERGVAFGIATTVGGIFMASGPLLGGVLTETLSWRFIFWIGVPFITLILTLFLFTWSPSYGVQKASSPQKRRRMDVMGPILLVVSLLAVVSAVMEGPDWGWLSPVTISLLVLGALGLMAFVRGELRQASPLIDLRLLRFRTFAGGTVIFALFQFEKIAVFVFVAQYFQNVLDRSPIMSGVPVTLAILPTLITSILIGKAADRFGSRLTLGVGASIHGAALLVLAVTTYWNNYLLALAPLILWGATMPSIAVAVRRVQMNALPKSQHGEAGGINFTIQMLGGTLGFALLSAVLSETDSYGLIFVIVGLATMAIGWIARLSMEHGTAGH